MIYQSFPKTNMNPNFDSAIKIPFELSEYIAKKKTENHLKLENKFK